MDEYNGHARFGTAPEPRPYLGSGAWVAQFGPFRFNSGPYPARLPYCSSVFRAGVRRFVPAAVVVVVGVGVS